MLLLFPRNMNCFKFLTSPSVQSYDDNAHQGVEYLREGNQRNFLITELKTMWEERKKGALRSERQVTGHICALPLACYLAGKSQQGMMGLGTRTPSQTSTDGRLFQKSSFCRQQQ